MAASGQSVIVRILVWIVFVVAAAVVAFFIGYLIGPYVLDRFFS